jgi:hypothetical protein
MSLLPQSEDGLEVGLLELFENGLGFLIKDVKDLALSVIGVFADKFL